MDKIFPVLMAFTAYSFLSLGFVLMKKGIKWMGWKGPKDKNFYWNLAIWVTGFIVMNIYGVPSAVALKSLPPHIVSAFAGWGIVMLVLFSFLFLKEKIYKTDYFFSALIAGGIFLLGYFERPTASTHSFHLWGMVILCSVPLLLFLTGFFKFLTKKVKTVIFASVSGVSAGLMVVSLRLLVINYGYKVSLYFNSIYLYLYIFFALLSFIALQLALKKGPMIAVGPVQYATNIIYPACSTLLVFQRSLHLIQFLALASIIYSVINILRSRPSDGF